MMRSGFLLAVAAGFLIPSAAALAQPEAKVGPSFSCAAPNPIEARICKDPQLSARDRDLAALYASAKPGAFGNGASGQVAAQRKWLHRRDDDCSRPSAPPDCILGWYDDRLFALAVASLFSGHDRAMAEIRRQEPKAAPFYEAIYRYATIDEPAGRLRAVAPLIAPAYNDLKVGPEPLLADITNAAAAAGSDHAFSTLLVVASTHDYRRADSLLIPCAALVRRPGLAEALEPKYGSAIDAQTPQADCVESLPGTPALDRLIDAATNAQPSCEGTIRFSLGANYRRALTILRLGRIDSFLQGDEDQSGAKSFIASHGTMVRTAAAELQGYYAGFPKTASAKRLDGQRAAEAAVQGAFSLCE